MDEKAKSIISYVFSIVGGFIVLFAIKDNERNTKIHAAQAIVIGVGYALLNMIYSFMPISIPFFSTALSVIYAIAIIMGIVKAYKEEDPELPVINGIAKSIFGKKIDE